jgi:hypothetical protein
MTIRVNKPDGSVEWLTRYEAHKELGTHAYKLLRSHGRFRVGKTEYFAFLQFDLFGPLDGGYRVGSGEVP